MYVCVSVLGGAYVLSGAQDPGERVCVQSGTSYQRNRRTE